MSQIYYITKENIEDKNILFNVIYSNKEINYYYSDDFSCEFYIQLARAGFISVSYTEDDVQYLLPEMQFEYAVLEFKDLHISQKVKKLLKQKDLYSFSINKDFEGVLKQIEFYHQDNWMDKDYLKLIKELKHYKDTKADFEIMCCELICKETNEIVAGEIGYKINSTYTSLSGFNIKEKRYNNWGKLQMTLLAQYLDKNNYSFWNLGHPYMQYKIDLGAKILSRNDFLIKWIKEINI
ncbi:MAG: hypothetical protein KAQ94_07340 [Arcobacteraceae bacterium]|nr:hypothetical protein [Arcobacteraceae bacterium]